MMLSQSAPCFILDISRLLSRAGQRVPTGIDRVELAYAEYLLEHHPTQIYFVALAFPGWMGSLPYNAVKEFISMLASGWNLGRKNDLIQATKKARWLKAYLLLGRSLPIFHTPVFYLLLSHHHLMKTGVIQRFLEQTKAYFIPMVHDIIPIEYPEYARPREPARHKARMQTVITFADAVIVPTDAVRKAIYPLFETKGRARIPIWTIPHGVHEQVINRLSQVQGNIKENVPYFVCLSTIEPRKNHLLLLHLWRDMVEKRGKAHVPLLILVGKRGWENENILDLLERSPTLQNVVIEKSSLSDEEVAALLKGSNGLLFPSFTEGYGLPLAEAMSLSVPSICADIPVLQEVGNDVPHYVNPLDTPGWQTAIDDFTQHGPLWQSQKRKLKSWFPIPWYKSVADALSQCNTITKEPSFKD